MKVSRSDIDNVGVKYTQCRLGVISPAFSIMHFLVEMILKLHHQIVQSVDLQG